MKVVLRALTSEEEILFEVGSIKVTVGRHSDNIVKVKDEHCSHNHCVFWVEGNKLFIEDLRSKNGTFVNGVRVQRNQVFIQDKVMIGDCMITVSTTHNKPDVIQTLDFPGSSEDRTYIGIALQTHSKLDIIRLNPKAALESDQRVLGKRITQKIIRPRGYQESSNHINHWHQSWRHWVAVFIDIICMAIAFMLPFIVMLWFDNNLDGSSTLVDVLKSPNLAIASIGSLLLGVLFRHVNIHSLRGTVGERITKLANVPTDQRTRKPS